MRRRPRRRSPSPRCSRVRRPISRPRAPCPRSCASGAGSPRRSIRPGCFFDGRHRLEKYARTRFGFEWTDTHARCLAEALTDAVLARLSNRGEPRRFLWVHYFRRARALSRQELRKRAVAASTAMLGRLFDGLRALKRAGHSLCVTADTRRGARRSRRRLSQLVGYEEQVRVPLIVSAPGISPRTLADPVELDRRDAAAACRWPASSGRARCRARARCPLPGGHAPHAGARATGS